VSLSVYLRSAAALLETLALTVYAGSLHAAKIGDIVPTVHLPTMNATPFELPPRRKNTVVYVDFWASWCGPCKQSFPWMNELHAKYAAQGLEIVAINVDTRRVDAERFLAQLPVKFDVAFDPQGNIPRLFAISGMPSSFLIDGDGKIVLAHSGFRDSDRAIIEKAIVAALAQIRQ
jgi:cytochrome c biogenesis protein CcmG, thiol:disulfide interchange protein DsbE